MRDGMAEQFSAMGHNRVVDVSAAIDSYTSYHTMHGVAAAAGVIGLLQAGALLQVSGAVPQAVTLFGLSLYALAAGGRQVMNAA